MSETMDINAAAEVVMEAEKLALENMRDMVEAFMSELAAVEATLPTTLALDASRVVSELRNNMSYVRSSSLPMALAKYSVASPANVPPAPITTN